jgi:glutathione S-transferase
MMKLYYSKTSPYSRKILLLAMHLGIADELEIIYVNPIEPPEEFVETNPLSKVPTLVQEGETPLFDSRVIAEFLMDRAGMNDAGRSKSEMLKRQALADGMMDAAFAIVMEARRSDAEQSAFWVDRWSAAIDRSLANLEAGTLKALEAWGLDSIAIACALDYICFRLPDLAWRDQYPMVAEWYQSAIGRREMQQTDPRI